MEIRHYRPGDENAQAEIFNQEASKLPAFKRASAEEVLRRYRGVEPDPTSKFYAVEADHVIGYAVLNANGRISYPWCLPGREHARLPLLEAVLAALQKRGQDEAWVAYRGDWQPVLRLFTEHDFEHARDIVNYVAEVSALPHDTPAAGEQIGTLEAVDLAHALALGKGLFDVDDAGALGKHFSKNPYFEPASAFVLRRRRDGQTLGVALAVVKAAYADPSKLDAAMPCFRLGAMGTERERHKRVNGMFSCVFGSEDAGTALLAEAARRFEAAALIHAAAQAPSDRPELVAFYDRHFRRQGSFPILSRRLPRP